MTPRNPAVTARAKGALAASGRLECAVCGWRPPSDLGRKALSRCIQAHHVVPLYAGGTDTEENLVPLCPTHHAVAHALLRGRDEIAPGIAPKTRDELVEAKSPSPGCAKSPNTQIPDA